MEFLELGREMLKEAGLTTDRQLKCVQLKLAEARGVQDRSWYQHVGRFFNGRSIHVDTKGALWILDDLDELCKREHLHEDRHGEAAFDGASLLLLSAEKLDTWERMVGHGRTDSVARIARIKTAAAPLKMPYAQPSANNEQDCSSKGLPEEIPKELHLVERHEEHAKVLIDVLEQETEKAKPRSRVKADIHTIGCCNGMGKKSAVTRIANPHSKDLDLLAKKVTGHNYERKLSRILACLPLTLHIPALCKAGGNIRCSKVAVADLLWKAFKDAAETQLNLKVSISEGGFFQPQDVFRSIRDLLGKRTQFMLNLDQTQEMSVHAKPGGWYSDIVPNYQREVSNTLQGPLGRAGEDLVLELAGTHGLWRDLASCIRDLGICAFVTSCTLMPYVMGTKYADICGYVTGRSIPVDLHPLSEVGILEICEKTLCSSGSSIIEALGFKKDHVRELEKSGILKTSSPAHVAITELSTREILENHINNLKASTHEAEGVAEKRKREARPLSLADSQRQKKLRP